VSAPDAGDPARDAPPAGAVTTEDATRVIAVDLDLCKACGICITLCPTHVFDADALGYPVTARAADCTRCLLCEFHCPDFAIAVERPRRKRAKEGAASESLSEAESHGVYSALATPRHADGRQADCGHDEEG
jgi:2-oxoglutarate ferredoxin oxidoreductase subunit delta